MRKAAILIIMIGLGFINNESFAQESNIVNLTETLKRSNSIDVTFGGTGLLLSANYSRVLFISNSYFVNASIGIGSVPIIGGTSLPGQLTFNYGKESSFLEAGIGATYWKGKSNSSGYTETIESFNISPILGYRKQFNNIVFRAYVNPIIHISGVYYIENYSIIPYLGISLGYMF